VIEKISENLVTQEKISANYEMNRMNWQ